MIEERKREDAGKDGGEAQGGEVEGGAGGGGQERSVCPGAPQSCAGWELCCPLLGSSLTEWGQGWGGR